MRLTKGELKSKLSDRLIIHDPELEIREVTWDKVYNYFVGYEDCFDATLKFPVGDSFAQSFILDETFKYLLKIC
jgi:hypothetical protein